MGCNPKAGAPSLPFPSPPPPHWLSNAQSNAYEVVEVAYLDAEAVDADGDVGERHVVVAVAVVELVLAASQQLVHGLSHLLRRPHRVGRRVDATLGGRRALVALADTVVRSCRQRNTAACSG